MVTVNLALMLFQRIKPTIWRERKREQIRSRSNSKSTPLCLVMGDGYLLALDPFKHIRIVTAAGFLGAVSG